MVGLSILDNSVQIFKHFEFQYFYSSLLQRLFSCNDNNLYIWRLLMKSKSLFTKNSLIDVIIYVKSVETSSGDSYPVIMEEAKALQELADAKKNGDEEATEAILPIALQMKPISWDMTVQLSKDAKAWSHDAQEEVFDPAKYEDLRFKKAIVAWNLKDEEGAPIPLTDDNIGDLHSHISQALILKYNEKLRLTDEEKTKNLKPSTK